MDEGSHRHGSFLACCRRVCSDKHIITERTMPSHSGCEQHVNVDPFLWRLQSGDLTHQLFVDDGTHRVQGGVPLDPIVEALTLIKGSLPVLASESVHGQYIPL
jgi:hypothetical protein